MQVTYARSVVARRAVFPPDYASISLDSRRRHVSPGQREGEDLVISRSETSRLDQILSSLKDRSILIVGDGDDFVQRGGMIRLATSQNKIRLIVNVEAAKAANLTLSSKLLRSAEIAPSTR